MLQFRESLPPDDWNASSCESYDRGWYWSVKAKRCRPTSTHFRPPPIRAKMRRTRPKMRKPPRLLRTFVRTCDFAAVGPRSHGLATAATQENCKVTFRRVFTDVMAMPVPRKSSRERQSTSPDAIAAGCAKRRKIGLCSSPAQLPENLELTDLVCSACGVSGRRSHAGSWRQKRPGDAPPQMVSIPSELRPPSPKPRGFRTKPHTPN
jgi:hypothetical protein